MASSSSSSSHVVLVDHDVPHGGAAGAGWGSDGGGGGGDAGFAPLPALSSSFERGPARDAARRALMLDDSCLSTRGALEPRRYDAARVAAFYAGAALSGGTLAVFAVWYRAAAARALSSPCAPADADIVLVTPADADKGAPPDVCAVERVAVVPEELRGDDGGGRDALDDDDGAAAAAAAVAAGRRSGARWCACAGSGGGGGGLAGVPPSHRMFVWRHTRFVWRDAERGFQPLDADELPLPPTLVGGGAGGGAEDGRDGGGGGGGGSGGGGPDDSGSGKRAAGGAAAAPAAAALPAGLSSADAAARATLLGRNVIDVPLPPLRVLLFREVLHPFVVFQVWAVIVWLTEAYWSFSAFILAMALATAAQTTLDVVRNLKAIRAISRHVVRVTVLRDGGRRVSLPSSALVPGDVLVVPRALKLPCDAVLVAGQATVTEAMLTGEATVVVKTPALPGAGEGRDAAAAAARADGRSTLFCGTTVVELRVAAGREVLALVVRTGFHTVKGRLVLSILHPRASHFKFMDEALRFLGYLAAAAAVGFALNAKALADNGAPPDKIVQRGADLVTIVVPPALPLAVTVGTIFATATLRKASIFCISPPKVNVAGKVNAFVFDKTGTLTSDGLELLELRPAAPGRGAFAPGTAALRDVPPALAAALATCHSLTRVAGELAGDPLELRTFAFTRARLLEPHADGSGEGGEGGGGGGGEGGGGVPPGAVCRALLPDPRAAELAGAPVTALDVLIAFPFSPALARMGVIVRPAIAPRGGAGAARAPAARGLFSDGSDADADADAASAPAPVDAAPDGAAAPDAGGLVSYVKGSPEALVALCDPASVPADFWAVLQSYARRGLRVLAAGARAMPASAAAAAAAAAADARAGDALRAAAESNLTFLGLIVLENRLKPETAPTLARLRDEAGLHMAMATGDNGVTAVAVAREAGLVERGYRVFLGDVPQADGPPRGAPGAGAAGGPGGVVWTDVDDAGAVLDPLTLLPAPREAAGAAPAPAPATGAAAAATAPYRLALTGRAFEALRRAAADGSLPLPTLQRALMNAAVFARMAPEAKAALVEALQAAGLYVGMIGDGANDSMALRAAHVGISLSQVEASVAAPFTYAVPAPSIDAIPLVLAEGRGALATSFCLFQFMALYSTIQFATAVQIAFSGSFLANNQYLYQDLFVVLVLAFSLGNTASARALTRKRPSGRLGSARSLTVTAGFIVLTFVMQGAAYAAVRAQPWFGSAAYPARVPPDADAEGTNSAIPETTSLFLLANFQYVACAAIFADGTPWKLAPSTNRVFGGWLLLVLVTSAGLLLGPTPAAYAALSLQRMPDAWHGALLGLSLVAAGLYFVAMAGVRAAGRAGLFRALERRGPPKPHKAARRAWELQFAAATVAAGRPAGGAGPPGAGAGAPPPPARSPLSSAITSPLVAPGSTLVLASTGA